MQLNQTIDEAFTGAQLQLHVTMTPGYQWNSVPNEYRNDTDYELVNGVFIEKGGDELSAAHQPDILARLLSKMAYEWTDCAIHELHA